MGRHCGCLNHKGTRKMKFKSKAEAIERIITYYASHAGGGCRAYECPRMKGVWHVTTERRRATK